MVKKPLSFSVSIHWLHSSLGFKKMFEILITRKLSEEWLGGQFHIFLNLSKAFTAFTKSNNCPFFLFFIRLCHCPVRGRKNSHFWWSQRNHHFMRHESNTNYNMFFKLKFYCNIKESFRTWTCAWSERDLKLKWVCLIIVCFELDRLSHKGTGDRESGACWPA